MNKITLGGPAFPVPLHPGQSYQGHAPCDGMTLRDYFAAKAMLGFIAQEAALRAYVSEDEVARTSYAMADAMLAARGAQ